jgi:hypothetical protein
MEEEIERYLLKVKRDGDGAIKQWAEKKRVGEIKGRLIKIFPAKTPEEIEELKQRALDDPEWYRSLLKFSKTKNRLRAEYPRNEHNSIGLSEEQAAELAKNHAHEEWFQSLMEGPRLAEDKPKTGIDAPFVAANVGGLPKNETLATAENHFGAIAEEDFDGIINAESPKPDFDFYIRGVEWSMQLLLSTQKRELQCLYASIAIGLLKNTLDIREMAKYHNLTQRPSGASRREREASRKGRLRRQEKALSDFRPQP